MKRAIDLSVSLGLLVLLAPLLAVLAAAVKAGSPGPVFYRSLRLGRDGRPFTMLKFRTMCDGADRMLDRYAHLNHGGRMMVRIPHDPRVTANGEFLRRTGLDELPQLLNVLAGDMSLVGPRPNEFHLLPHYSDYERQTLAVKPGITGLWQVSGRESHSFESRVEWDLQYIREYSLLQDLRILGLTWKLLWRRLVLGVDDTYGNRTGRSMVPKKTGG